MQLNKREAAISVAKVNHGLDLKFHRKRKKISAECAVFYAGTDTAVAKTKTSLSQRWETESRGMTGCNNLPETHTIQKSKGGG